MKAPIPEAISGLATKRVGKRRRFGACRRNFDEWATEQQNVHEVGKRGRPKQGVMVNFQLQFSRARHFSPSALDDSPPAVPKRYTLDY